MTADNEGVNTLPGAQQQKGSSRKSGFRQAGFSETRLPLETVWKLLSTGQPPHHQSRHRHVDKGLPAGAQPLVVLAHSTVVRDPREGALHHPSTRQDPEAFGRHQPLPVHLLALFGPLLGPDLSHLLGNRLWGLAHHLDAQPEDLLGPLSAPTPIASVHPQVLQARELGPRRLQQQLDAILVVHLGAVYLGFEHQTFSIHQQVPLAATNLLATVIASLLSAHSG